MKLLTLNTHSWLEADQERKFEDLVAEIIREDYDLICLQEINQLMTSVEVEPVRYIPSGPVNPPIHEDNYAQRLVLALEKAGQLYHWSWAYNHIGYGRYHEGVAILSKQPFEARAVLFSQVDEPTDHHTRRALLATVKLDGVPTIVASLHMSWWDQGFADEWNMLEQVLLSSGHPVILAGDFNNPTDQEGYRYLMTSRLALQDSHKQAAIQSGDYTIQADIDGWEGNQHNLKVDHVFFSPEFEPRESHVVFDGKELPIVSDHFGVRVQFVIKDH